MGKPQRDMAQGRGLKKYALFLFNSTTKIYQQRDLNFITISQRVQKGSKLYHAIYERPIIFNFSEYLAMPETITSFKTALSFKLCQHKLLENCNL